MLKELSPGKISLSAISGCSHVSVRITISELQSSRNEATSSRLGSRDYGSRLQMFVNDSDGAVVGGSDLRQFGLRGVVFSYLLHRCCQKHPQCAICE